LKAVIPCYLLQTQPIEGAKAYHGVFFTKVGYHASENGGWHKIMPGCKTKLALSMGVPLVFSLAAVNPSARDRILSWKRQGFKRTTLAHVVTRLLSLTRDTQNVTLLGGLSEATKI
jgi:hypothetical protein